MSARSPRPDKTPKESVHADAFYDEVDELGRLVSEVEPERVSWVWPGRIALGKTTLIDGDPGLGKSVLTLEVAAHVSTGKSWPDGHACPVGGVVLLSAEDGLGDTIRPRLEAAGADCDRVLAVNEAGKDHHPVTLADLGTIAKAAAVIEAAVVIVDPLMAYLSAEINAHRDQDVRRGLRPLVNLAEEMEFALVMVRHLNKGAGGPVIYRGGGSIGLIGAARIGLVVGADPNNEERRILAAVKANLSKPPASLAFRLEPYGDTVRLRWDGTSALTARQVLAVPSDEDEEHRSAVEAAATWLRDYLLAEGQVPAREVQKAAADAAISRATLRRAKDLVGVKVRKALGPGGRWLWRLEDAQGAQGAQPEDLPIPDAEHLEQVEHLAPEPDALAADQLEAIYGSDPLEVET